MFPTSVLTAQPAITLNLFNNKKLKQCQKQFLTGASRGFGKLWAEALLQRGDKVVATARDLGTLDDLAAKYGDNVLPLKLDVNNRAAGFKTVARAEEHFGRIDVLINNAGYGLFGVTEEMSGSCTGRAMHKTKTAFKFIKKRFLFFDPYSQY